ncbi:hypothetical protein KL932_003528 [Ogataea haglerorum]|nr:hypothetical protein KL950_001925 [Ogataea haglerorum]KAG7738635.1 hypothetical protein KL932_003528 [Ogataea haglerorum]KAG7811324.1 hypothetical protein KL924_001990 [Ogataea haglerorum]
MTSHPDLQDTEAAGLLMLFSHQSQRLSAGRFEEAQPAVSSVSEATVQGKESPSVRQIDQGVVTSPGPAAAALASGSSNNKAMVAAAALAAAAATPLPLLTREKEETKPDKDQKEEEKRSDSVVSYAVDPDSGVIGCVCAYEHDDGFTIQCDRCFRWQHAVCMGIDDIDDVPETYLCYLCDPSLVVNAEKARKLQAVRMQPKRRRSGNDAQAEAGHGRKELVDSKPPSSRAKKQKTGSVEAGDEDEAGGEIVERYQTLYVEIDGFEYKSGAAKTLVEKLATLLLQKDSQVPEFKDEHDFAAKLLAKSKLEVRSVTENAKARFNGLSKLYLSTAVEVRPNQLLSEIVGEIDLKDNYIGERWNQYWLLGCAKPKAFFHPRLPLVVDQRGLGNVTRFVRKSCFPNCEVRSVVVGNRLRFVLAATQKIESESELTLPWEWDDAHPIRKLRDASFDALSHEEQAKLVASVQAVLDLTECGCASGDCLLAKVRRASTSLQRQSRKHVPELEQTYEPLDVRELHRDRVILETLGRPLKDETQLKFESASPAPLDPLVLPPKYQIIKKYLQEPRPAPLHTSDKLYVPVPVVAIKEPTKVEVVEAKEEERPKVVKKFSLADYKKKSKGEKLVK